MYRYRYLFVGKYIYIHIYILVTYDYERALWSSSCLWFARGCATRVIMGDSRHVTILYPKPRGDWSWTTVSCFGISRLHPTKLLGFGVGLKL